MVYDDDVFVRDEKFYDALGFRYEDNSYEALRVEQVSDSEIHEAQILVDDNADCETNILVDKENSKTEIG